MNGKVEDWVAKAEGDLATARRELRARKYPNYDSACFHSQQCAEKYLKAFLVQKKLRFHKIHDLRELSQPLLGQFPELGLIDDLLSNLNPHATATRYPGYNATREIAKEAVRNAEQVRQFVRQRMNLPPVK